MPAPASVTALIDRFQRNLPAYKSGKYNETQARVEFVDPLFMALGWDVHNEKGYAEAYKDVVHEAAVKVGGVTKAPDYSFRVGGARKFFLEAKKPSVDIKNDVHPAYQLRRYAWSAKLPLGILTDFEEFAVYDCRTKPSPGDSAAVGRVLYLRFTEYVERWDEIAAIFSREAILLGSFDQYADSHKAKRGTAEVDSAFLEEIERWRDLLARNIALRNPQIAQRELNFAVQQTIDRIIFLRICEDRGVEPYGTLMGLRNGSQIYPRLVQIFRQADARYNSGLFHFDDEKGRPGHPDNLTPGLSIDDKTLKEILKTLYYPDSPYEFSVLPADILGQVYEQFLGKVIRLTAGHQARVEEKPEVRKAGGVYYTPTYIVDYIVRQTVGKLVEGKRPGPRGGVSKLRILDPACGSGSFLIGAYRFLLDWHLAQYLAEDPAQWADKANPQLYRTERGEWRLTIDERKRILLKNLYGVDIDPQAVEVTKLSLLLKVLEGESEQTLNPQLALLPDRVLPDLAHNIRCGNSLIGPDFYEGQQLALLDEEEAYRINVFEWESAFPEVFAEGGFDGVIGNPPWLMAGYYVKESLEYLRRKYQSATGKFDLYYLFVERGYRLLSPNSSKFGMIIPNKFFHTKAASFLRRLLAAQKAIAGIVDFGDEQLFDGATNYSCILLLDAQKVLDSHYTQALASLEIIREFKIPLTTFDEETWYFEDRTVFDLFHKMESTSCTLESMASRFGTGVQSGADRILTINESDADSMQLESNLLRPILRGRDVRRYASDQNAKLLVFPYKVHNEKFVILTESELRDYPKVNALLANNRAKLDERIWFGKNARQLSGHWYGMMYIDGYEHFSCQHLLTPALSNRSNFTIGVGTLFATGTAGVTSVILKDDIKENIRYVLGILNSQLLSFYATHHSPVFSGGYYKFSAPYLRKLPIRPIDFTDPADAARHDQMVALVQRMLDLHKQRASATLPHSKELLQRQIDATDRQIDRLVYELYGLTDAEIRIVEGRE